MIGNNQQQHDYYHDLDNNIYDPSHPYLDHDYSMTKQESWPQDGQLLSVEIDNSSFIYPHPAPVHDLHPLQQGHHLPLHPPPSPCSPQSIADATMTELTELSPVLSVHMDSSYNDFTEQNLDILADAFNTALSDVNEEEMFKIQPVGHQDEWTGFNLPIRYNVLQSCRSFSNNAFLLRSPNSPPSVSPSPYTPLHMSPDYNPMNHWYGYQSNLLFMPKFRDFQCPKMVSKIRYPKIQILI